MTNMMIDCGVILHHHSVLVVSNGECANISDLYRKNFMKNFFLQSFIYSLIPFTSQIIYFM